MLKKRLFAALVAVLLLYCIAVLARNKVTPGQESRSDSVPEELEQKIVSFELSNYAEDGSKKWNLKGDSADILAEVVNLSNIEMDTYDDPKINLTALLGSYDRNTKEISLYRDVVVLTSDGARLTTEYLNWDGRTDTITTDEPVRMVRSDVVADGIGALAMPQMKKVMLDKDIRVKLTTERIDDIDSTFGKSGPGSGRAGGTDKVTITCNGPLMIDYEENTAVFEDDVLVDDRRGKIYSDRMDAFLDPVTKNIKKVVAVGNVKVVRGEDTTYSDKAIYTTEDRKIVLVGRPKIHIRSVEEVDKIDKGLGEL
jgi:LPS export ABC transporter protein LptC